MWVPTSIVGGTLLIWLGIIGFSWFSLFDAVSDIIPLGIILMWFGLTALTIGFVYQLIIK